MYSKEEILRRDFSDGFVNKMKNTIEMSHYKYGWASETYPRLAQCYKCIQQRLEYYEKTHNKDYLIDIANFAMLEFLYPSFSDSKYTPDESDSTIGLADGISYKQMMEELEDE